MSAETEAEAVPLDEAVRVFAVARPRLFGIAYRILGSATEADDVVQDAWIRWQNTDRSVVRNAPAFLATTTTRLALNVATSARSRRETYIGPWLPEPVDTSADPALGAERGEALQLAVLVLLEKLPPTERAAYILREAFDYSFRLIAETLELSEANARQLVGRARVHLASDRRATVSHDDQRRLLEAFIAAAGSGDLTRLESLLAEDVVTYSDGGGVVHAARIPVIGRQRVATFITGVLKKFDPTDTIAIIEANGQPAVLVSRGTTVVGIGALDSTPDGISQILFMLNPGKLGQFRAS